MPTDRVSRLEAAMAAARLIVPSAAGSHQNLVVFKDLVAEGETVQIIKISPAAKP